MDISSGDAPYPISSVPTPRQGHTGTIRGQKRTGGITSEQIIPQKKVKEEHQDQPEEAEENPQDQPEEAEENPQDQPEEAQENPQDQPEEEEEEEDKIMNLLTPPKGI